MVDGEIPPSLVMRFMEVSKAKSINEQALQLHRNIESLSKGLNELIEVLNEFLGSGDNKSIEITEEGEFVIHLMDINVDMPIGQLSSGEKQLIIFFTILILGLQGDQYGILIEDEPELSLHVSWQRDFIDKALKANGNAQLIFATHSPSIIAGHEKYAIEVKRNLSKSEEDK